jgi:(1->4)-alpha-D-glucan 1-alpha-D-glucosylmutase
MLATATHDHKRGEDVRARLAVLSDVPELWRERVEHWENHVVDAAEEVDPADRYMLYQTIFGAWPEGLSAGDGVGLAAYAQRLSEWQQKALREAKLRSSWQAPNEDYEGRCKALIEALLDPARSSSFLQDLTGFVARTGPATLANSLVQTGLRYTVPGVPDLYQGSELGDFSLVDPDNRRPVDYALRRSLQEDGGTAPEGLGPAKLSLISELLRLRRAHTELFERGSYVPVTTEGERAEHILAFERIGQGRRITCAFLLRAGAELVEAQSPRPRAAWWGDTCITSESRGRLPARDLFAAGPVAILTDG